MKKRRIYTEKDWREGGQIDRIYMHLMEPERWPLTDTDQEKCTRLQAVWQIILQKQTQRERLKIVAKTYSITERQASTYLNEASELFVDLLDVDYALNLRIAHERFKLLSEKAEQQGEINDARRCEEAAAEILEKLHRLEPMKAKVYIPITITTNPAALAPANPDNYLDYAELIPEPETAGVFSDDEAV